YSIWMEDWFTRDNTLEKQLDYWKEQLKDSPQCIALATDQARAMVINHAGSNYSFKISSSILSELKKLSHLHNSTLFMTLLSAFNIFLAFHSGQEDILVGVPVANR